MNWKIWWLPMVSFAMLLVNLGEVITPGPQSTSDSFATAAGMSLVWVILLAFSLRFALSRRKRKEEKEQEDEK